MWTAIKARQNTTHLSAEQRSNGPVPGAQIVPYNAAASACLAVWFYFWLWAYNTCVYTTFLLPACRKWIQIGLMMW